MRALTRASNKERYCEVSHVNWPISTNGCRRSTHRGEFAECDSDARPVAVAVVIYAPRYDMIIGVVSSVGSAARTSKSNHSVYARMAA